MEPETGRAVKVDRTDHLVGPQLRSLLESALDLAADPERRIKCQADVQYYVDIVDDKSTSLGQRPKQP